MAANRVVTGIVVEYTVLKLPCGTSVVDSFCLTDSSDCCGSDHSDNLCCPPGTVLVESVMGTVIGSIGPDCSNCAIGFVLTRSGPGWGGGGSSDCNQGGSTKARIDFAVWCDAGVWMADGSIQPYGAGSQPFSITLTKTAGVLTGDIPIAGCGDATLSIQIGDPCQGSDGSDTCVPSTLDVADTLFFTTTGSLPGGCSPCSLTFTQQALSGEKLWRPASGSHCRNGQTMQFGCHPLSAPDYKLQINVMPGNGCGAGALIVAYAPVAQNSATHPFWWDYDIPVCVLCGNGDLITTVRVRISE